MEKLVAKIEVAFKQTLKGSEITQTWNIDPDYGKIVITVLWEGFEGLDSLERQELLWKILRKSLTKKEQGEIAAVFTETPAEKAALEQ